MSGHRHSSHAPRPRARGVQRAVRWTLGSAALVAASLGLSLWLAPDEPERYSASVPIARAMLEGDDHVWPPVSIAPIRPPDAPIMELDAGETSAGDRRDSPLRPAPVSRPGFAVREDQADGMHYFEVVFGDASFTDELPIIVVLHGRGGHAQIPGGPFASLTHPVRVIVPQAPDRLGQGFQWIPVYVSQGLIDKFASTLFATAGRLARLIRDVVADRGAAGRPIVTGFSQGGIVTLALALYHDDVVGAALPMSSWLPPPLEPAYRRDDLAYPTIRAMHGDADATVPIVPTRELFARLTELQFDVVLETFPGVGHETNADMNALFHEWLEEAVCRARGDAVCAAAALHRGRVLTGVASADAGPGDAGLDGAIDADAAIDGGELRDANGDANGHGHGD